MDSKRIFLSEKEIPTAWYNLQADLPKPVPPPLHPGTKQPLSPADLESTKSPAYGRIVGRPDLDCFLPNHGDDGG